MDTFPRSFHLPLDMVDAVGNDSDAAFDRPRHDVSEAKHGCQQDLRAAHPLDVLVRMRERDRWSLGARCSTREEAEATAKEFAARAGTRIPGTPPKEAAIFYPWVKLGDVVYAEPWPGTWQAEL